MNKQTNKHKQEVVLREGFLTKQGDLHKNWKQRYFKLTEYSLDYYKPNKAKVQGK